MLDIVCTYENRREKTTIETIPHASKRKHRCAVDAPNDQTETCNKQIKYTGDGN